MPRTKSPEDVVEQMKDHASTEVGEEDPKSSVMIPTGSTLLNLALSDRRRGGFCIGKLVNLIGDSSSGKSMMALTIFAEMSKRSAFDNYRLIHDDVEAACEFDLGELFGEKMAERIEAPCQDEDGNPQPSDTIEEFQKNVINALNESRPFVYILDSLDALDAMDDRRKAEQDMEALRKGKETTGSYRMAKPKMLSEILRRIVRRLKKTDSLLVIISQTRDNINPMSFAKKTRSGGRALEFYSSYELWTAIEEKLKRRDRVIGIECLVKVSKNRFNGKRRKVAFPIYDEYGIDDISSCVEFLLSEGVFTKKGEKIEARGLGITATRDKLIREIEERRLEKKLRVLVSKAWHEIEAALKLNRRRKYE